MNLKTVSVVLAALFAVSACGGQEQSAAPQPASAEQAASAASEVAASEALAVSDAEAAASAASAVLTEGMATAQASAASVAASANGVTTRETAQGVVLNLSSDVLFDFGKAGLKPAAAGALEEVAAAIQARGTDKVTVIGYTDAKGSDELNHKLSLGRAQSVKDWLVRHGLKQEIAVEGRGAADPVAPNTNPDGSDNPEGRAQNRRVEILLAPAGN